jgi:hypothetical protein
MEGMGVAIEWGVNNRARQPKKEKIKELAFVSPSEQIALVVTHAYLGSEAPAF